MIFLRSYWKEFLSVLAIGTFGWFLLACQFNVGPIGCEPITPVVKNFTIKMIFFDASTGDPFPNADVIWESALYLVNEIAYPQDPDNDCEKVLEIHTSRNHTYANASGILTHSFQPIGFNDKNEYLSIHMFAGGIESTQSNHHVKLDANSPSVIEVNFFLYKHDFL